MALFDSLRGPSVVRPTPPAQRAKQERQEDLVNWVVNEGIERGVGHLVLEDGPLDGRRLRIRGQEVINFGSASYLGLETDPRLADGAAEAVRRFGSQLSSSRAYLSSSQYPVLEGLLEQVFGAPVIVTPSTTLAHMCALPTMVREGDVVLLDQQAHSSLKMACDVLKARGVRVELVPHNSMEKLEERLDALSAAHRHVWYVIDGIYSMHGDYAPMQAITRLMDQHEQLHVYIDDAHGMSWSGQHGRGSVLGSVKLRERMVVACSLNKAFGGAGGVLVFPSAKLRQHVRNCGTPLLFSGPVQPPMLGVNIASAKLHLSAELGVMQQALRERIAHCNQVIKEHELPLAVESDAPIFFVKVGLPTVGANLMKRLFNEGYYVNVGVFPAVALRDTGIRFSINRHQTLADISDMVSALAHHLPLARRDELNATSLLRSALKLGASKLLASTEEFSAA